MAASSLEAAHDGASQRRVEVRVGEAVLARTALLVDSEAHGPLLRLGDLKGPLPPSLPPLVPVTHEGALYVPVAALGDHARLDRAGGLLTLPGQAPVRSEATQPVPAAFEEPVPPTPPAAAVPASPPPGPPRPRPSDPPDDHLWLDPAEAAPVTRAPELELSPEVLPPADPPDVRRRDPIEEPLVPTTEWQEWLFQVTLNGQPVSDGALVLRGPGDALALRVLDLRAWRVRLDSDRFMTFNGEQFLPLAGLPGAIFEIDESTLALDLALPPAAFEVTEVAGGRVSTLAARAGRGGFLDYDLLFLAGEGVRPRLDALLEAGVFDRIGVLLGNFRVGDVTDADEEQEVVRLETTYIKDFPERRASLQVGDGISAGGALGRPVRFGGIQYSTNFAVDPGFITFPLPSIGGLAEQPGLAEVYLNNTRRIAEEVPPGPFEIDSLPVVTGAGEIQVKVTDLLGREQLITQDYYVSPRLLREDLSEFSYALGFERAEFNRESFAYDDPFLAATHRYGFTNAVTGEARLEAGLGTQAAGAGGSLLLGSYGLLSGGLTGSHDEDAGAGFEGFVDYEYVASRFSVGLRTRYSDEGFRQLGLETTPDRRTDQVSLGLGLHPFGRIGFLFVNTEGRERPDRRAVSGNYSIPVGPGALLLNALQTLAPAEELAVTASYTLPLGGLHTVSGGASWREDRSQAALQLRRGRGASDVGLSYRLQGEVGDEVERVEGSLRYDASIASAEVDLGHARGQTRVRANLSGSLAHVDGHTGLTRRLGRAFGMVALPGHPDVRVYLENREVGVTDEAGYLLLPRLNPYQANRVRISAEDLPLTAEIGAEEELAVPFARSGVRIAFDVTVHRTALVTLSGPDGAPLPAGLELVSADGRSTAQVADQGQAYVRAAGADPLVLGSVPGQPPFTCALPGLPDEPMALLEDVRCE